MENKKVKWIMIIVLVIIAIWLASKTIFKSKTPPASGTGTGTGTKTNAKVQGFPIVEGDSSNEVKQMQQGLNGRYHVFNGPLVEDGIYGPLTRQALIDNNFPTAVDQASYFMIIGSAFTAQTLNSAL
jgi:hypothetical protein